MTSKRATWRIIERLQDGVEISTPRDAAKGRRNSSGKGSASTGRVENISLKTLPCVVERLVSRPDQALRARLRIILREGKNRQIRKMLGGQGITVVELTRVRFGPVGLEGLSPGGVECLSPTEVAALLRAADCRVPVAQPA